MSAVTDRLGPNFSFEFYHPILNPASVHPQTLPKVVFYRQMLVNLACNYSREQALYRQQLEWLFQQVLQNCLEKNPEEKLLVAEIALNFVATIGSNREMKRFLMILKNILFGLIDLGFSTSFKSPENCKTLQDWIEACMAPATDSALIDLSFHFVQLNQAVLAERLHQKPELEKFLKLLDSLIAKLKNGN